MKFTTTIKNIAKKLTMKSLLVASVATLGLGLTFGAVQAEFYPDRQPFDYSKACNPNDADIYDRCGSLTGPVFNSFINTPSYGDERTFADARRTDQTASGSYKNVLPDVTEGAQEIVIRTYVHNNANQGTNESGEGIAHGAKVRIALPTGTNNVMRARSYISADNAALVEDTVDFTAAGDFRLEYVTGSAIIYNDGPFSSGQALSDDIVTTGATIGYDALNGDLPGCFDYDAQVLIRVRVIPVEQPTVSLTKQVRIKGDTEWKQVVTAAPGDQVQWLMTTEISGGQQMDNITIRDVSAPNTSLVSGTVKRIDGSGTDAQSDAPLFSGGLNMGNYAAGSGFYTMYDSDVLGDFTGCEARVRNLAFVKTDQKPTEISASADVIIKKDNCQEPVVSCDSLTAPTLSLKTGESTVFTASATATGTTISKYIFSVNGSEVQNSATSTYTFSATSAGNYIVTLSVQSADGQTVTSNSCVKTVEVEEVVEKIVTCDSLTAPTLSLKTGESTVFTASATATNATITGYAFSIGGSVVQDSASDKYTFTAGSTGTYVVSVVVKSSEGDVTSVNCVKTVDVQEEIVAIYRCETFTLNKSKITIGESVTATVRITAKDGAIFKLATFTFGDEQRAQDQFRTNAINDGVITASHTYSEAGDYGPRVKIEFEVNGQVVSVENPACVAQIEVTPVPVVVTKKCTVPGKTHLPVGSKDCSTPIKVLPKTGAGSIAGILVAVTAAGSLAHRRFTLRRS